MLTISACMATSPSVTLCARIGFCCSSLGPGDTIASEPGDHALDSRRGRRACRSNRVSVSGLSFESAYSDLLQLVATVNSRFELTVGPLLECPGQSLGPQRPLFAAIPLCGSAGIPAVIHAQGGTGRPPLQCCLWKALPRTPEQSASAEGFERTEVKIHQPPTQTSGPRYLLATLLQACRRQGKTAATHRSRQPG